MSKGFCGKAIILTRVGSIVVDEVPQFELNPGECAYIPTGAILPKGADAVVMIEYVEESWQLCGGF